MPLDPTTGQVDTPPSDPVAPGSDTTVGAAGPDSSTESSDVDMSAANIGDPSGATASGSAASTSGGSATGNASSGSAAGTSGGSATGNASSENAPGGNATGAGGVARTMSTAVAEVTDQREPVVPDGAPPPSRILPGETGDEIFNRLIVPEMEIMWRVALSLTRNRADAEDVVQEALLRAYRAIHTFDGRYPRAWVLTILRNTEHNRHRRKRPQLLTDPDSVEERGPATEPDAVEQYAEDREFDQAVVDALAKLPENFRQVIELVDIDGLAYQEAADVLDVPLGTVMSRLHRARRRIRELLIPLGYGPHGHSDHTHVHAGGGSGDTGSGSRSESGSGNGSDNGSDDGSESSSGPQAGEPAKRFEEQS